MRFTKVESIGNDFVLVEHQDLEDASEEAIRQLSIAICERRFGVGSDGLLLIQMEGADLRLRMFNPDGTEDFCGNGLRCAGLYAYTKEWVGRQFTIQHHGRAVGTEILPDCSIRTVLGKASFDPKDVPLDEVAGELYLGMIELVEGTVFASAVTTGSTHTVIFVDDLPADPYFSRISSQLEHHPLFPERTSVIWTREIAPMKLQIRIWERGVGETLGCGTGSSAAAAVYVRKTGLGGEVSVENPGGHLAVKAERWDAPIEVSSHAKLLFEGEFTLP
jgi:diaminopimelate epimerase